MKKYTVDTIIKGILAGEETALARGLTIVENRKDGYLPLMKKLYPKRKESQVIGITGPPGAGKSTLTSALVKGYKKDGHKVGVLAVDPSSPFSGGAILGDRIRMMDLAALEGVFIRSMASRGALGGLSPSVLDGVHLMEAYGCSRIIIETVGVGQSEIDVVGVADTVAVILMPGVGDDVQALKAGLMEIGDLFVINKADQEGADRLLAFLRSMLERRKPDDPWQPPVLKTVATQGKGLEEVINTLKAHAAYLKDTGEGKVRREKRAEQTLLTHIDTALKDFVVKPIMAQGKWQEAIAEVQSGAKAPGVLARTLLQAGNIPIGGGDDET